VLSQSGYEYCLRDEKIRYVDLNRDQLMHTPLRASYTGMRDLWLPRTVLEADLLVSMPKIKAHHWSGVTLSMKNMFGVVPGTRYGWPNNILHWKGIQKSILDLCATVLVHFVIADGVVAMEGNGPLNGTPRPMGKIVFADDPVAADATCARLMRFEPGRITHICEGPNFLGNTSPALIDQVGETFNAPAIPFQLVPEFRYLHSKGVWLKLWLYIAPYRQRFQHLRVILCARKASVSYWLNVSSQRMNALGMTDSISR
jgi:uncharacterized protein (DUF362 family)